MSKPKLLRIKPLDAYPIGSIYMSFDSTNPADIFGGIWERLKDKFLMPAGDTYGAGSTGGSAEQTLLVGNMPAHTHTRGTMEITGSMYHVGHTSGITHGIHFDGTAFKGALQMGKSTGNTYAIQSYNGATRSDGVDFIASNSWTGETSSEGGGASFSVMPPYITVYTWKRIA